MYAASRTALAIGMAAAISIAVACGDGGTDPKSPNTVMIGDNQFLPASITIELGTRVRWINNGLDVHDVTEYSGLFVSGAISPGTYFEAEFAVADTFDYACTRHPGMLGEVVVE